MYSGLLVHNYPQAQDTQYCSILHTLAYISMSSLVGIAQYLRINITTFNYIISRVCLSLYLIVIHKARRVIRPFTSCDHHLVTHTEYFIS